LIAGVIGKVSVDDKMRILRLHEQGLGYRAISAKYPEKNWKLDTVKLICKRVDETGSTLTRKPGGGRPRSVCTPEMIEQVGELIFSQENQPRTSKSTRKIAEQLNIHRSSIQRIVKRDLQLSAFRRVPAQIISESVKQKRHECCKKTYPSPASEIRKEGLFTYEKNFYFNPPVNHQNDHVWSIGKKQDVDKRHLVVEQVKFAKHVMVSAGVCHGEKRRLHFIPDKAKVNGKLNCEILLPRLV